MTGHENERIRALEVDLGLLRTDVHEIKADVKAIRTAIDAGGGAIGLLQRTVPWLALVVAAASALMKGV